MDAATRVRRSVGDDKVKREKLVAVVVEKELFGKRKRVYISLLGLATTPLSPFTSESTMSLDEARLEKR